ncbi:uncharacterized protein L969DRAFT_90808 [Mixia osmundae IAM 14324]|nr:uncharacterized protein L969DRAFT_90808 [Mixia osmundae IAM 14324]KEI36487.1 hypothetical protein L969DRAFT_90808 [Mixia osmundae IAM 14324]
MSDDAQDEISLAKLLGRTLLRSDAVLEAPSPTSPPVQAKLLSVLADLRLCRSLVDHLGVLSPNETLEDLSTATLRVLLLPAYQARLTPLLKSPSSIERQTHLSQAKAYALEFLDCLERYQIIAEDKRDVLVGPSARHGADPAAKRNAKLAQYRMERQVAAVLAELAERRSKARLSLRGSQAPVASSSKTLADAQDDDEDRYGFSASGDDAQEDDDVLRSTMINLLTLHCIKVHGELASIALESELLASQPAMVDLPSSTRDGRQDARASHSRRDDASTWRLDDLGHRRSDWTTGPVLSSSGKVLRPFTILPSTKQGGPQSALETRLRLQAEVFQPDHRLPTMSIDEFLEIEQAEGRIISGGGQASAERETTSERTQRIEEGDNAAGYAENERHVREQREWDLYTDDHRRGEGNRHNRG